MRKKRKLSQQLLAKKTRITQGFLSLVEQNKREPTMAMLDKISRQLGVPKEMIFLLACKDSFEGKKFAKPLHRLALALDDVLVALDE